MIGASRIFLRLLAFALICASTTAATLTSSLPAFYTPGQSFIVTVTAAPGAGVQVQAIEDAPPSGWTVSNISHGGAFDAASGKVKWGPFTDSLSRMLSYQVTPPANATNTGVFSGSGVFDSQLISISGARTIQKFPGTLVRHIPTDYVPGVSLSVSLDASPASDVTAWAAEELVPAGWAVTNISHNGVYDSANHKIKWGPFFDATARSLAYAIRPATNARTDILLSAAIRFDAAFLNDTATLPIRTSILSRTVPASYVPGTSFDVTLRTTPASYVQAVTLEELIPVGWTPSQISGAGTWDAANHKIKWGPFFGPNLPTTDFTYRLTPAQNESQPLALSATAIFDELTRVSNATIPRFLQNAQNMAIRALPSSYRPGHAFSVSITATPTDTALVYAIQENIPNGWSVSTISHGGVFDSANHQVKWGPFFDSVASSRILTYQITPPTNAFGAITFSGNGVFNNESVTSTGDLEIGNAPPTVFRTLPPRYNPDQAFTVTVTATPVPGILTYAVEEQVPVGWAVGAISDGGAYDSANKKIKWGPFLDQNLRPLTYQITPPSNALGTNFFSGEALFNEVTIAVSGATAIKYNNPPSAVADNINRPPSSFFKLSVFALLANDTDADNDFLNVTSVVGASDLGGTVQLDWPWIYYTPPVGLPAIDFITYTVTDTFNGISRASVKLTPTPPPDGPGQNIISIQLLTGGSARILFGGVPSFTYHIQTSTNLTTWTSVVDRVANNVGQFEFTDTTGGTTNRYYRTLWP